MENKKLKIALFCDTFFPMVDGVINVVDNYAKRLDKIADVCVFVAKSRDKNYVDNFPYKVVRCQKALKISSLDYDLPLPEMDYKFIDAINEFEPDIIHIHSPFSIGQVAVNYAKQHHIPCIATCHSQFKTDFYKETKSDLLTAIAMSIIMPVFNGCDECWAVNKEVGKLYYENYKLKQTPRIRYNGTEMLYFEDKSKVDDLRKQYNIKDDEKVFLFVGRIHVLKNIFFIMDALKELDDRNFKFKMIFVGTGPDYDALKERIENDNLQDKVILAGRIMDRDVLAQHYQLADLFLFPSLCDCSSLVQIEAASQKTPTLFIRGSITSGTCTEGVDAFFSENSCKAYADKIIEIFNNKEEYDKICEGAYKNVYITWDEAAEDTYNEYLEIIKRYNEGFYDRLKNYVKHKKATKKKVIAKRKKKEKKLELENKKLERANKKATKIKELKEKKINKTNLKTKTKKVVKEK